MFLQCGQSFPFLCYWDNIKLPSLRTDIFVTESMIPSDPIVSSNCIKTEGWKSATSIQNFN